MPLIYVAQFQGFGEVCPLGPWALLLTPLCGASALLLSPYLPRRGSDNVFFDLAGRQTWQMLITSQESVWRRRHCEIEFP